MPENTAYQGHIRVMPVTLPSGAAEPAIGVDLGECRLIGMTLPAEFDGTAMTFTVADTYSGTYRTLHNGTANVSLTVAASRYIGFSTEISEHFKGIRFVKPVSGTSQSTTDTIINLHLLPVELGL